MVSKRVNLGVLPQLPNEILQDIFLRLPIKTLVKQTAVCKLWNSLIKTSTFVHSHQNRNRHNHLLLTLARAAVKVGGEEIGRYFFYLHCDKPPFNAYKRYYQYMTHPFVPYDRFHATSPEDKIERITKFDVMETCNGLVCLVASSNYTAMVWNPCIRKIVTLPRPTINTKRCEISKISHGFGYDSRTLDYKVVRIVRYLAWTGRKTSYEIWSLAQPSWKALSVLPPVDDFRPSKRSIFVHGAVHWVHERVHGIWMHDLKSTIVSFDMSDEVFGEIMMPSEVMKNKSHLIISRYRNSLAILQWNFVLDGTKQLDMWVMKEYGVVDSWIKLLKVELPKYIHSIRRLGFRNNGEALIRFRYVNRRAPKTSRFVHKLLNSDSDDSHDSVDFQAKGGKFFHYLFVEPIVESLVLLDHPSAISI